MKTIPVEINGDLYPVPAGNILYRGDIANMIGAKEVLHATWKLKGGRDSAVINERGVVPQHDMVIKATGGYGGNLQRRA